MSSDRDRRIQTDSSLAQDGQRDARLRAMFDGLDSDKSGVICADELLKGLSSWGYQMDSAQIDAIQLAFGGKSNDIDFTEFREFLGFFADVRAKFKVYDADSSNSVDKRELARLLYDLFPFVTAPMVEAVMKLFDANGTESLEFKEVFSLLVGLRDLHQHFPSKTASVKVSAAEYHAYLRSMSIYATACEARVQLEAHGSEASSGLTLERLLQLILEFKENRDKFAKKATEIRLRERQSQQMSEARRNAHIQARLAASEMAHFEDNAEAAAIVAKFKSTGKKFEDPDFPATMASMFPSPDAEAQNTLKAFGDWRRPEEIAPKSKKAQLFLDGIEQGDVIQGSLGDCWMISALAVLAQYGSEILQDLFVTRNPEAGFYQVKFWKNGQWRLVTVDDRLPCTKAGSLLFGSCRDKAEFWVPIIEKAYAKLHGSYQALVSGKTTDALVDFTGEGSESLEIARSNEFWNKLRVNMRESFLMGCSRHAEGEVGEAETPHGLIANHAYGILRCEEADGIRLVCLRNPWGQFEWKGRWSDGSADWETHPALAQRLGYQNVDDGTFWMSYDDFCREFTNLYVLRLYSDATGELWHRQQVTGRWTRENSGGCLNYPTWTKNPQYQFTATADTKVFVSTVIRDPRSSKGPGDYEAIGKLVLKKDKSDEFRVTVLKGTQQVVLTTTYKTQRECSFEFDAVAGGTYVLVPSFFEPGVEGEFYLRVYSRLAISPLMELTKEVSATGVPGEWKKPLTVGGCPNNGTWRFNPQFSLVVTAPKAALTLVLEQEQLPELPAVGFYIFKTRPTDVDYPSLDTADKVAASSFTNAPQVSTSLEIPAGVYHIMACTFNPNIENKFVMKVLGDGAKLSPIKTQWNTVLRQGEWKSGQNGGCVNHPATFKQNPVFKLTVKEKTLCNIVIMQETKIAIGYHIFRNKDLTFSAGSSTYSPAASVVEKFVFAEGEYYLLAATFNPGENARFSIAVFSDSPVELVPN